MVVIHNCDQYQTANPMPLLKMKTKSTTGLKEKKGLHVCRKSKMITKKPLSPTKISQNAEIGTDNRSRDGVSGCERLYEEDLGRNYINNDDCSNVNTEPVSSTSSPSIDTIFSPILESIDIHNNEGFDDLYMPQLDSEDSEDGSRSSSDYHACNVSDFYISDMIFSVPPPIESNSVFDNKTDTMFFPDYKSDETSLLCDLTEEYMVLPFLEDTLDTIHDHDGKPSEETIISADHSSLYMAIHQVSSYNQENHVNPYPETDYECFDPQMYIRNLPDQQDNAFLLPYEKQKTKKITLVLDLDETLVHSSLEQCDADFTFPVFYNMKEHIVYVKRRPHLQTFLEKVAEMFEIVIFTASQSIYAKQLLDILDPDGKFISKRAYRESCILSEGCYVKDLTVLGVDLAKVAIIDNSPQVFRLQVNNGIPIQSWFDDPSDCALISLLPFLESLVDADDVRPIIARKFGHLEIYICYVLANIRSGF